MPQKCSTLLFIMNSTCQGTLEQEQYYSILTRDNLAFAKKKHEKKTRYDLALDYIYKGAKKLILTWALRSSDVHLLQCKGSTLFTTITIQIQATETYFRLTAPIIYRQKLTVPNWRRHKPTASDNRHARHLKLRERRKESPETTAIQVMSLITLVTSNLKQNNKLATNWH